MPKVHSCVQGSTAWLNLRAGIPTASEFDKIITPGGKASASAEKYLFALLAERIMGHPRIEAVSTWMNRGSEMEAEAVSFYELQRDAGTVPVGFVTNNDGTIGASPDRLVGDDGLLEIKVPSEAVHVSYLLKKSVDQAYYPQVQGQLWITEHKWVDILSYHPEMPPALIRVERNEEFIKLLSVAVEQFSILLENYSRDLVERGWIKAWPIPRAMEAEAASGAEFLSQADLEYALSLDTEVPPTKVPAPQEPAKPAPDAPQAEAATPSLATPGDAPKKRLQGAGKRPWYGPKSTPASFAAWIAYFPKVKEALDEMDYYGVLQAHGWQHANDARDKETWAMLLREWWEAHQDRQKGSPRFPAAVQPSPAPNTPAGAVVSEEGLFTEPPEITDADFPEGTFKDEDSGWGSANPPAGAPGSVPPLRGDGAGALTPVGPTTVQVYADEAEREWFTKMRALQAKAPAEFARKLAEFAPSLEAIPANWRAGILETMRNATR